jgi:hypothetical protein
MNKNIKFRLSQAGGVEVQPLWFVLAVVRKHGFRTLAPVVRSGLAGSFLLATLIYVGEESIRQYAIDHIRAELGYECTQPAFAAMREVEEECATA